MSGSRPFGYIKGQLGGCLIGSLVCEHDPNGWGRFVRTGIVEKMTGLPSEYQQGLVFGFDAGLDNTQLPFDHNDARDMLYNTGLKDGYAAGLAVREWVRSDEYSEQKGGAAG